MDVGKMQRLDVMIVGPGCGIRRLRLKQVPGSLRSAHALLNSLAVELTRPFLMLAGRAHALRGPKAEKLARVNYEEKKKSFFK